MITLRDYQQEALACIGDAYLRGIRRQLVSLPTGTGKTILFSSVARGAVSKERRVLILAHRDELIEQARDKLLTVAPELALSVGTVKAKADDHHLPVTVASVQTLAARGRLDRALGSGGWDIVVVDEAHHSPAPTYQRILEAAGCFDEDGPLTIGVTATPQRADGKDLGDTWQEIVYHRDLMSMIRAGYLVNLRGLALELAALDLGNVGTRGRNGDYKEEEAGEALTAAEAPMHTAGFWQQHAAGRKTICFTPTVALAGEMAQAFRDRGITAERVSGMTPMEERRAILRRFSTGQTTVVCNAMVLTEGFDEPGVECIIVARPTKSQPLYVQMVGRGTRLHPGKQDCLVIDVVGASSRLDLTTLPRLAGLGDEESDADEMDDLLAAVEEEDDLLSMNRRIEQERAARAGKIVARQVELFRRQEINWHLARPGVWCLSLAEETLALEVDRDAGTWDFIRYQRDGEHVIEQTGLDLGYAMGVAEEYARRQGSLNRALISKAAAWRGKPASSGQREALRKWRFTRQADNPDLTAGEASDLITQAGARKDTRRAAR